MTSTVYFVALTWLPAAAIVATRVWEKRHPVDPWDELARMNRGRR